MELKTDTIYLRPITEEDTEMVLRWRNSKMVKQYFIYRKNISPEEHRNRLIAQGKAKKLHQFILCVATTDRPVGSVYLQNISATHKNAEYGIFIGEQDALGQGYGTAAAKLILQYAFKVLGLHKVYLRVLSDNGRAIRSYENAGFRVEGILRDEIFEDGVFRDVTRMSILREEFKWKRSLL